jgi:RNA polymerase sigma factor (TIGR02999 family)
MSSGDVTLLLEALRRGDADAPGRLIDAVYGELRRLAEAKMRALRSGHTLQPTALVHEAYLRLIGNQDQLEDRGHFFGAAAKAMERVLVDHARQKKALKRGGGSSRETFHELQVASPGPDLDVLEVHDAIATLETESPELASLVRYRYFVGLTLEQVAEIDAVSLATVKRQWTFARAWLYERLGK